ncbi:MAG: hypothetical protein IJD91_01145 [Clostridia bacterium]|nr:hypothetical protein [Clostridia bacterium]
MVDVNLLKSEYVKQGYTQRTFCKKIEMAESTFSRRLKRGDFKTEEAGRIIDVLNLAKPEKIFFAKKLT